MHLVGQELLVDLAVVDLLLYRATSDQAIHSDLLLLSYPPGSLSGLHVGGRIPVRVIDQDPANKGTGSSETSSVSSDAMLRLLL